MRLKVLLSGTDKELPIEHQDIVNSFIHRVLGSDNKYHDAKSNYSISTLRGGKWITGTKKIAFNNGGYITISSLDETFINDIILGLHTTKFHADIKVVGLEFVNGKFYNGWNHFATLSPIIIKDYSSKKEYSFKTLDNSDFETVVKNHLINKISKMAPDLDLKDFQVKIPHNPKHKVTKMMVKNVANIGSLCHISIHTNKKVAELIYNIGIGQSTGSGFGTIYKTENKDIYR